MNTIFSDLKIVDLSTVLAGPSVTTFFAELGAEVIKIENKKKPDVTRSWKLPDEDPSSPVSAYFSSVNFRKDYLELDLNEASDRQELFDLVKNADILVSNFKMGDEEKLGVTDQQLRKVNPKLIIGKISGFGSNSDRVAYDLILQAETGFMSMNGTPESGPVKIPVALIDVLAGHQLKEGLLIALFERQTRNVVRSVSVSLYDAAICSLMNQASNYLMVGHIPQRIGTLHPNIAPYGELFKTKDQQLITLAVGSDHQFKKLCELLNVILLAEDARFRHNSDRISNREELFELLKPAIESRNADEILQLLMKQGVPAGKLKDLKDVFVEEEAQRLICQESIDGKDTKRVSSIAFKVSS
jgi:crotonobetainyl-CoA:carnitine CoA-transferase CaiB-like acyl-CoA transferase